MLTPNGFAVSARIFLISSRISSSRPEDVSMIPIPPAFDTADASCARAIHPMGAWTMGYSTPSMSVMRFWKRKQFPSPKGAWRRPGPIFANPADERNR